jgi:ferritin-like metal-binding protein YciE
MSMDNLNSLLLEELKDLYSAEKQLTKALPKMAKKASSDTLKQAFTLHLEETQGQIERLEQIAEMMDARLTGKVCKAMQGLIEEGKEILEEDGDDNVIDCALIGAAQRIEHYEIAAYGTARAIAEKLGEDKVVKLLQATLDEEGATDEKLTTISEEEVLEAAASAGQEADEEEEDEEEEEAPKAARRPAKGKSTRSR